MRMEYAFAVLCVWLLLLSTAASYAPRAVKEGYQTFVVGVRSRSSSVAAGGEVDVASEIKAEGEDIYRDGSTWSAEIVHRDSLFAEGHSFERRLARDAARVEAVARELKTARAGATARDDLTQLYAAAGRSVEDLSSPIVSGKSRDSGEYFTRIGIGTPARQSYLVMDTGSDVSWTQCEPCRKCYKQSDPVFDPSLSSTFQVVGCGTELCKQLETSACRGEQCLYGVAYGDGSFTVGTLAQETFTFELGATAAGVAVGCGHDNEGLFSGAAGLLGLGGGKLSFPSQIRSDFSYCLVDSPGASNALLFGRGAAAPGSAFTPLVRNPKLSTFYYVSLQSISVGGRALRLSRSTFALSSSGSGGVILDSGTVVTRLVPQAYEALRDAFRAGTSDLRRTDPFSLFDTCYDFSGLQSVEVPTVDFHFAGGATMHLPGSNIVYPVDGRGTYCFTFAPSNDEDISIIGNIQQQGFRIAFSTRSSRIGFAPNCC